MLEVLVRNAHGNLSDKHREYASKKLGKLGRYFHSATKVEFTHVEEKRGHKIQVTVFADGMTLRGEEVDEHVHAAIDKVADKLETRLRRLKSRLIKRHRHKGAQIPLGLEENGEEPESAVATEEHNGPDIAKERHYDLRPISLEDAALQLELLDHPFFVFQNVESSRVEVIYKLESGGYGLVTPEQ